MHSINIKKILSSLIIFFLPSIATAIDPVVLYGPFQGTTTQTSISSAICLPRSVSANNAGRSDFVLGFTPDINPVGRADVISGQDGSSLVFSRLSTVNAANFGKVMATARDLNGDSVDDFLVASPSQNEVYVYLSSGNTFSVIQLNSLDTGLNLSIGDQFGSSLSAMFASLDANPNAMTSVIVGAPKHVPVSMPVDGLFAVFNAASGVFLYRCLGAPNSDENFGAALTSIGDVNNDGFRDILVGAPLSTGGDGRVVVISGNSIPACTPIYSIPGPTASNFGSAVAALDDLNGDAIADFIVGAPKASANGEGGALVYSGAAGTILCDIKGTLTSENLGTAVAALGDANNDFVGDFLVGSPRGGNGNGSVSAFSYNIATGTCDLLFTINAPLAGRAFGSFLGGDVSKNRCDMNGDGLPEFIVGANKFDGGPDPFAIVYSIPTVTPTATPTATPRPTRTATPIPTTISQLPKKSRLTYRISQAGNLSGEIVLDKDPRGQCKTSLIARYSSSDLTGVSAVTTVFQNRRAKRSTRFSIRGLSKPDIDQSCTKPYILHMISKHRCGTKNFSSNVYSRYLNCGAEPMVPIATFMEQLAGR